MSLLSLPNLVASLQPLIGRGAIQSHTSKYLKIKGNEIIVEKGDEICLAGINETFESQTSDVYIRHFFSKKSAT